MKKYIAIMFIVTILSMNSAFAKVYTSFEQGQNFRAGDVIEMQNSLAFPSYIYRFEVEEVIKGDGSIAIKGTRTLVNKYTGEVSVSENHTQIITASKQTMNVVVNIDEPPTQAEENIPGTNDDNEQSDIVQNSDIVNGNDIQQNHDTNQNQERPDPLAGKQPNDAVKISPIRGLTVEQGEKQDWQAEANKRMPISTIIIVVIIFVFAIAVILFIFLKRKSKNRSIMKQFIELVLIIALMIQVINIPVSYANKPIYYSENFESVYKDEYITYGRTYERSMSAFQGTAGELVRNWNSIAMPKSYSQPLVSEGIIYHYAGNKIHKIDINTGAIIQSSAEFADNVQMPNVGNMTIRDKYIFVGDRSLNVFVIDKTNLEAKATYSLTTDSGYNPSILKSINEKYGSKGITSSPFVDASNDIFSAYFGTSVGLFGKLVVNQMTGVFDASILNHEYQYNGQHEVFDDALNGSSICIVSSPVCIDDGLDGDYTYEKYLYIGTPYAGAEDGFSNDYGYLCLYDIDDPINNVLQVKAIIEGGVETTMAYDRGNLIFSNSYGEMYLATVTNNGYTIYLNQNDTVPLLYNMSLGSGSKPVVAGSPSVFRFANQTTIAAFAVAKENTYMIAETRPYYADVMYDELQVYDCQDPYFGGIVSSPHILQVEDKVYMLYSNGNKLCALDLSPFGEYGSSNLPPAEIFSLAGGNMVSEIEASDPGTYITSELTVTGGRIIFSSSDGKLHSIGQKAGDGDFIITDEDLELYRIIENPNGTLGEPQLMDKNNDVIEIAPNYLYMLRAKIGSTFIDNLQDIDISLSASYTKANGQVEQHVFRYLDSAGNEIQTTEIAHTSELVGMSSLQPGPETSATTVLDTKKFNFLMNFAGDNVTFRININSNMQPQEAYYTNNEAFSGPWAVSKRDINLFINKDEVYPQNYIDIKAEPLVIFGTAHNSSKNLWANNVPIALKVHNSIGQLLFSEEIRVDIPPRDNVSGGKKPFQFEVDNNKFEEGKQYIVKIEVNPVNPSTNQREVYEMSSLYYPGNYWERIFDDNVVELQVDAIDKENLDTYSDLWFDSDGELHVIKGELTDWIMYNKHEDYSKLGVPGDNTIKTKAGYGIDLRSVFTLKDVGGSPNEIDWSSVEIDTLHTEYYIIKPDSYALYDNLGNAAGRSGDYELAEPYSIIKGLNDGNGEQDCIEMIVFKNIEEYSLEPVYKIRMDNNFLMDSKSIEETESITGESAGETSNGVNYLFAFEKNLRSPYQYRRIYTGYDTPDNIQGEAYTLLVSTTFKGTLRTSSGDSSFCKVRTTNLYCILEVKDVMFSDDSTNLLE